MKYNILFAITAHENFALLLIHIQNIFKFNPESGILIHLSKRFDLKPDQVQYITQIPHVFVNPNRLETHSYKILTPIYANMVYSLDIDYEYMCLLASNSFFYKSGAYDYIRNYDYGAYAFENRNFTGKFADCRRYSISIGGTDLPNYSGQHEGSFMKKELIPQLVDSFTRFCPLEQMNYLMDTTEECILPTGLNILFKDLKRGYPICLIRDRMKYGILGTDNSYHLENTKTYIHFLINNPDATVDYVLDAPEDNHFFTFKRIDRSTVNHPLLDFIMSL
jgi:hypothetical protein